MTSYQYIDSHAHLNFSVFANDLASVAEKTVKEGVAVINVGTKYQTSKEAVRLSRLYENFYAIIGLHPIHTSANYHDKDEIGPETPAFNSAGEGFLDNDWDSLLAEKVVAIGETGLDYYRLETDTKARQKEAFLEQISFAIRTNLPLMLHIRPSNSTYDAYYDVLEILQSYRSQFKKDTFAQVHFFAGDTEIAKAFLDLGCMISFTGVVTFAGMYEKLVNYIPLDRLLTETDCPYVAPYPYRGQRNEPVYVKEVTHKLAKIKKIDSEVFKKQVLANASHFFGVNLIDN